MGMRFKTRINQRLQAHGGNILSWPEGKVSGVLLWILSSDFRRDVLRELKLENYINNAAVRVDAERVERRLLAVMGVEDNSEKKTFEFNIRNAISSATLSLMLGVAVGGLFSKQIFIEGSYADLTGIELMLLDEDTDIEEFS